MCKSEFQYISHLQLTPKSLETRFSFCSLELTDCDYEQGGKGIREKQVTKTCFQEPASMYSMTVSGERKHTAFC